MKPICVPCERFMRPKHNGFYFVEGMPLDTGVLPGKAEPDRWTPYKAWVGDLWHCPDCGTQTVIGVAAQPLAEHYQDGFAAVLTSTNAMQLFVKDC